MNSRRIFSVVILLLFWVILSESASWLILSTGIVTSYLIVVFCQRMLPIDLALENISLRKLWFYPVFIIGQVYLAGWSVLKIVLSPAGERTDFVTVQSKINSPLLKAMLFDSVTLTPGTIYVKGLSGDSGNLIVWLRGAKEPHPDQLSDLDDIILGSLENALIKAEN